MAMFWLIDCGEYKVYWVCLHNEHQGGHDRDQPLVAQQEVFCEFSIFALIGGPFCKFIIVKSTKMLWICYDDEYDNENVDDDCNVLIDFLIILNFFTYNIILSYMWEEYELEWTNCAAQIFNLKFSLLKSQSVVNFRQKLVRYGRKVGIFNGR